MDLAYFHCFENKEYQRDNKSFVLMNAVRDQI